jgi:site-specific DNA-methyltransferase (adenine-specific)
MEIIYTTAKGKIIYGDNLPVIRTFPSNIVSSCISDFPYSLNFMGKKWDTQNNFYEWCNARAVELYRVMKSGGYVCIFGHPKTNHRMKCAFEDAGFTIVEEIDWLYLTGFPKNQDIGKLFDKSAGVEREVIGKRIDGRYKYGFSEQAKKAMGNEVYKHTQGFKGDMGLITEPFSDLAKKWDGFKTSGLKPSHETITIFQKPLDGTYITNLEKHGCGAMNIDACRVSISQSDIDMINAKSSKTDNENYSLKEDAIFGEYDKCYSKPANTLGRFPPNIFLDEEMAKVLDEQTGISKSSGGKGDKSGNTGANIYGDYKNDELATNAGGSRIFPIFKYCPKVNPKERLLPNGTRNPHVTLKPKELFKWLIKLVTPKNGLTIDITAGSCTHGVASEELNLEGYNLKWVNIELLNTKEEPYCDVGKMRIENIFKNG